ncbi:hypothetical protein TNCV_933151 [Trichonephila clavipes]|nr:hypothetical protein TNCV_933151 [Trichonephila clavipes]
MQGVWHDEWRKVGYGCRATRSPIGRRVARPMGRVPLSTQIAFLPCTSQSQDKSKAHLPIVRENLGYWSIESL